MEKFNKRDQLLKEILELIDKYKVTAYEIEQATPLTAVGVQKIINGETKRPLLGTLETIISYINSKYIKDENEQEVMLAEDVVSYDVGVPYYDIDFVNGFAGVIELNSINPEYRINYPPARDCDFWVNATGNSMLGVVNHGDKIALKTVDKEWFPLGEIYAIVTTNGHRMVKRISSSKDPNCYRLISENPNKDEYPDQDIPKHYIQSLFKVVLAIKMIN